jgi:hypothetical protein
MGKRDKRKSTNKAKSATKDKEKSKRKQAKHAAKHALSDSEESEDLDTILQKLAKEQVEKYQVTTTQNTPPPSSRQNASWTLNPLNNQEIFLFGGELHDGKSLHFYNDLHVFNHVKNEWKLISCPHSPGPRSSHQAVSTAAGQIWIFGGEFASKNESHFYHHRDLWSLDVKNYTWTEHALPSKHASPCPRSGHRMTLWQNKHLVLFGGFTDNGTVSVYHDDLWIFSTIELAWFQIVPPPNLPKPSPRSGFQFFTADNGEIYLYGGYSKTAPKTRTNPGMSKSKLAIQVLHEAALTSGLVTTDLWVLKLPPPTSLNTHHKPSIQTGAFPDPHLVRWELKKRSSPLNPMSGCTMISVATKARAVMFGGVRDIEETEEKILGVCSDKLHLFLYNSNKWVELRPKNQPAQPKVRRRRVKASESKLEESKAEESSEEEKQKKKPMHLMKVSLGSVKYFDEGEVEGWEYSDSEEEPVPANHDTVPNNVPDIAEKEAESGLIVDVMIEPTESLAEPVHVEPVQKHTIEKSAETLDPHPLPRFSTHLAATTKAVFMYGGILEQGSKEFALGDLWKWDLEKGGWECLVPWTMPIEAEKEVNSEVGESSSASESESEEEEEEEDGDVLKELPPGDHIPSPLDLTLKAYFARTRSYWVNLILNLSISKEERLTEKEAAGRGFDAAEKMWEELLPTLKRERKKLEELSGSGVNVVQKSQTEKSIRRN